MSMNRDNFRANQPPSKVLHIRNLPPDATEQEIIDLCKPFGRIVKTKLNAGQVKNQAFVEFENVNCAIQMIYSFVGSADPPKVRNKTVYLQYSTRQEIGSGNWGSGSNTEQTGNVILIIMDNIQVALGPNLDTVHMLCAAFGDVAKIAMFEKASGLQALVQFKDTRHAREAQQTLDGTSIPEHLVPNHPGKIPMKVSFSAHPDLNIRSQSERSRDFTNPYLPDTTGQTASMLPSTVAAASTVAAPAAAVDSSSAATSNVLQCMLENVAYSPSLKDLHTVFSTYGHVQKMTLLEKSGTWQAMVQYSDDATAGVAKQYLNGHTMYPGGKNKLKLAFAGQRDLVIRSNNDRNWNFLAAPGGPAAAAASQDVARAATIPALGGAAAGPNTRAEAAAAADRNAAAGAAGGAQTAASSKSEQQMHDPHAPITGADYEHAHNDIARQAVEALGDSLAGVPGNSSGPKTMVPHPRPARPPVAAYGYGAPPPAAYGYPPQAYPPATYGYAQPGYPYGY